MPQLFAERFLLTTLVALVLLLVIAAIAGRVQTARRSRELMAAINAGQRGRIKPSRGPSAAGFSGALEPAPEPFVLLSFEYRAAAPYDLFGQLLSPFTHHAELLVLSGRLPVRPRAELVWQQGLIPARAMAHRERSKLWVQRRLDVVNAEYAVRGPNTGAIEHVFFDLQTRFRPFLVATTVQAEVDPELAIVLRLSRFNLGDMPALITSVRELGRAALRD